MQEGSALIHNDVRLVALEPSPTSQTSTNGCWDPRGPIGKQTNKQTNERTNKRTNERTNKQTNKRKNKQKTNEQTNEQTNKQGNVTTAENGCTEKGGLNKQKRETLIGQEPTRS